MKKIEIKLNFDQNNGNHIWNTIHNSNKGVIY